MRIGGVPYGVGEPLMAGLDADPTVALTQAPPAELIDGLRRGELDAALVSSIEAIRRPGYTIAPGLGIACRDRFRSVRAFRRRGVPIRTVGLDQGSATSVALLRLLMAHVHAAETDGAPEFTIVLPTRMPDELREDLILLIGDAGLEADPGDREVWDLGHEWRRWTGLPFVFALWVLRPGADHAAIVPVLQRARAEGRRRGAIQGPQDGAHYELADDDLCGLRRFWSECRALGLGDQPDPPFAG